MNFAPNKTPIEIIKEGAFGGTYIIYEIYILILIINGIVIVGKNLIFYVILILNYIQKFIMMSMLINIKQNAIHLYDFGKIKDGFVNKILMDGFNGVVDII